MKAEEIKARIESLAPGTQAEITDLTGTEDHWQAVIISPAFSGKPMIEQHRLVYDLFKEEVQTNEVHALSLKTFSPEQYEKHRKQ